MSSRVFRFVPFKLRQDTETEPVYEARCVSGDEQECGAESAEWITPHPVEVWMEAHLKATGHRHYRRSFHDNAVYQSPDGSAAEGVAEP